MAICVVDRLEVIQVDDDHSQGNPAALIGAPGSGKVVIEHGAVGQTGEVVALRLLFQNRECAA